MPFSLPNEFDKQYADATGDALSENTDKVEPGVYMARISKVELKVINKKDTVIPHYEIVSNLEGGESTEMGKTVSMKPFYLTDRAIFRFAGFLKMLNVKVSDRQVCNADVLIGRVAAIEVIIDQYTGNDGNQYSKAIVGQVAPPEDKTLNSEERDASVWVNQQDDLPF